jgi:hypothetical protein
MRVNPNGRVITQFGRPSDRSERIGKKPHEADLSYTAVCTGLSEVFISDRKIGKKAKGTREHRNQRNSGAYAERLHCCKNNLEFPEGLNKFCNSPY